MPPGSTSPKLLPKKDILPVKGRVPEFSGELPLLKKVLLMKIMEDKKADGALAAENDNQVRKIVLFFAS